MSDIIVIKEIKDPRNEDRYCEYHRKYFEKSQAQFCTVIRKYGDHFEEIFLEVRTSIGPAKHSELG